VYEVSVAFFTLGDQDQVVIFRAVFSLSPFAAVAGGHVKFAADERIDALSPAFPVEPERPEHVAVIGYGKRGLAQFLGACDHFFIGRSSVKEREIGVYVKMDEILHSLRV